MHDRRRRLLPAIMFLVVLGLLPVRAQTRAHAPAATTTDLLQSLPASDVVLVIEHSRILHEAIPRFFGNNPAPLAKIFAAGEEFKAKTGIDPRSISRVVIGARFINLENIAKGPDKKDFGLVIIAQGDFEAQKLVDFLRSDGKERVREEQSGGQTIYSLDERPKGSTTPKPDVEIPAMTLLDANTIALGDLAQVRATVAVKGGGERLSPELLTLATRNSNALISLAGNVPPGLTSSLAPKGSSGSTEMDATVTKFFEAVAAIRQMSVSLGLTVGGVEASLGARFNSAEQAQSLGDMLLGARQQYNVFIEDKMIRDLVNSMQITAESDEVQLRLEVPQTLIMMMLDDAKKKDAAATATKATTAKPAATTTKHTRRKARRGTRRKKA
ncbi:MAG: hypothetical protein QOF02_2620 [Blastocatellia bacterium]|nr:hypothetical protein [Blastocatellia bacterium]